MRCESALLSLMTTATFSADCPSTPAANASQNVRHVTASRPWSKSTRAARHKEYGHRDSETLRKPNDSLCLGVSAADSRWLAACERLPPRAARARRMAMAFVGLCIAVFSTRDYLDAVTLPRAVPASGTTHHGRRTNVIVASMRQNAGVRRVS